ncbi:mycothiol synthase [Pseudonocardia acidicola]|uniref:Mycothiol acetyltransferase n=1 Tax=Pseudonocardia acidicola TaxID=2724939 RepID=A0ABX1SDN8_9PSEU|nr:mycothiol synthase [Pseudonocardia acidicola]NMH98637.1 mycothiol synthase [Pseudonocardia acidicola]
MTQLSFRTGLDQAETTAVTALADAATEEDGTAPLSEQILLNLRHGTVDGSVLHVLAGSAAAPTGYAQLDLSGSDGAVAELAVHPAHRRSGIGAALVEALLQRAGGRPLWLWAHGEHPGATRLAERFGFSRARVLWQLHRSLTEPLPPVELPDGVRLRAFVPGQDEAEFLRVNNAAFDWHPEQGGWDTDQVARREAESWFDPAGFLLAVGPDGRLLGFHWTKVHPGAGSEAPMGEVYVLGVDPAARGRRLGSGLTLAGLHHLRDRGLQQVMLYVEADNDAAVRVYRNLGFTLRNTDVAYRR